VCRGHCHMVRRHRQLPQRPFLGRTVPYGWPSTTTDTAWPRLMRSAPSPGDRGPWARVPIPHRWAGARPETLSHQPARTNREAAIGSPVMPQRPFARPAVRPSRPLSGPITLRFASLRVARCIRTSRVVEHAVGRGRGRSSRRRRLFAGRPRTHSPRSGRSGGGDEGSGVRSFSPRAGPRR